MKKTNSNNERIDSLRSVINYDSNYEVSIRFLKDVEWDYEGIPVTLTVNHMNRLLEKFLREEMSKQQLYEWADFIEVREDIQYEIQKEKVLSDIVFELSSPEIQGELNSQKALKYIDLLNSV